MNTQESSNLDVKYLEMVTCTSTELNNISKPVNGRLYHTSDTNIFYFDWNNRRHQLSVFSDKNSSTDDTVTKTELSNWLQENDYITSLSLSDEIVKIIGSPIEKIITLQALENYANNNLLTKSEIGLLNEPLSIINDIADLKLKDNELYSFYSKFAKDIQDIRATAATHITENDLNTKLVNYLSKESAMSTYLSKLEAEGTYVSASELITKLSKFLTTEQINTMLKEYVKSSDVLSKKEMSNIYFNKSQINNMLQEYAKLSDLTNDFVKMEDIAKEFVTKSDFNKGISKSYTKSEADEKFLTSEDIKSLPTTSSINQAFAKKLWVDENYVRKGSEDTASFAKKDDVSKDYLKKSDASNIYLTKESADKTYLTQSDVEDKFVNSNKVNSLVNNAINTSVERNFAKKLWVDEYYLKIGKSGKQIDSYLLKENAEQTYLSQKDAESDYLSKDDAEKTYLTIKDADENYVNNEEFSNTLKAYPTATEVERNFAKRLWVDEYYMRKTQIEGIKNAMVLSKEFNTYAELLESKERVNDGFYFLEGENAVVVSVGSGENKKIINIQGQTIEPDISMYFGGDDVNW